MHHSQVCSACRYFTRNQCRYDPPVILVIEIVQHPLSEVGGGQNVTTRWPDVSGNDWCGKWCFKG